MKKEYKNNNKYFIGIIIKQFIIFFRNGTLKFDKVSEYGPPKIAVYDTSVWAEATLQFNGWKEYFQNDRPAKCFVYKDYYFVSSIWPKNNVRYSGMHCLNTSGEILPKTGVRSRLLHSLSSSSAKDTGDHI